MNSKKIPSLMKPSIALIFLQAAESFQVAANFVLRKRLHAMSGCNIAIYLSERNFMNYCVSKIVAARYCAVEFNSKLKAFDF